MHCGVRIIDEKPRHIHICLVRDCAGRGGVVVGPRGRRRHWQHRELRKNCQLESARRTALLGARGWPGGEMGGAAGPKIGCGGGAGGGGGAVVGGGAPAPPASKKQSEESQRHL
ncbi:uncharacterized protein BDCG_05211 [Blastomyces dermatitidis ER-3]|uniref:Uncharacterized protein n=1 Tax=Ajellomyces dermatitidis (strain ER-3 / ATCC MYA-2586) TaxID=559297 RepID=A0ABP2F0E7_AJEDR|nr:uncharacterized protein BDCG_05211 [Blastomyces dermatitidis ER-3]EEQ90091.1 hypothetical protein BDCG_05211 [Blastomyces dermatitidis ER-3]